MKRTAHSSLTFDFVSLMGFLVSILGMVLTIVGHDWPAVFGWLSAAIAWLLLLTSDWHKRITPQDDLIAKAALNRVWALGESWLGFDDSHHYGDTLLKTVERPSDARCTTCGRDMTGEP